MKVMNKLFAALVLFGMSNAAFGYTFSFKNKTNQSVTVDVFIHRPLGTNKQTAVIKPNKRHAFTYAQDYCLGDVSINGKAIEMVDAGEARAAVCSDLAFDITKALGTTGANFKLEPASGKLGTQSGTITQGGVGTKAYTR